MNHKQVLTIYFYTSFDRLFYLLWVRFPFYQTTWIYKAFRNCSLVINIIIVRLIVLSKHFYGFNVLWYKMDDLICYYLIFNMITTIRI